MGGLGTASYGLTKGMWENGDMDITFVIPKPWGDEPKDFANIIGANSTPVAWRDVNREYVEARIGDVMDPQMYYRLRDHIYGDFNYMSTNDLGCIEFSGRYPRTCSRRSTTTASWRESSPARWSATSSTAMTGSPTLPASTPSR